MFVRGFSGGLDFVVMLSDAWMAAHDVQMALAFIATVLLSALIVTAAAVWP